MVTKDLPVPNAEINAWLSMPASSIGPTRRGYLHKLCRYPAIEAPSNAEAGMAM